MSIAYFTPDGTAVTSAGPGASALQLPGTPAGDAAVLVSNLGQMPVSVKLFAAQPSAAALALLTMASGPVVMPGQQFALGIARMTYLSVMTGTTGTSSTVSVTTGN